MKLHAGAEFLRDMFAASTEHPVFVCSLLNAEARGSEPVNERHVATRHLGHISDFAEKWDRPGRGLYFCVSTLKPGAQRRAKETVSELNGLHADIDFKSIDASPEAVRRALAQCACPPSRVNNSGHGLHCFWIFAEALQATPENIAEVERLLGLLADYLGADRAAAEVSRLLRLPGSHNSKDGGWVKVVTESNGALVRYALDDLCRWLEAVRVPLIARRPPEKGNGQDSNPWVEVAARHNFKPPVNVEQRLGAMQFQGAGDSAIHPTQLTVSASLLTHGTPIDDVVTMLLEATRVAAGSAAGRWNWQREERDIRDMCGTWLAKHPEIVTNAAAKTTETTQTAETATAAEGATASTDHQPGEQSGQNPGDTKQPDPANKPAASKQQTGSHKHKRAKVGRSTLAMMVADGVIKRVRQDQGDLLLTGGELHVYHEGIWAVADNAVEQELRVLLQEGAETLGYGGDSKLLTAAWRRLLEHPGLFYERVDWDPVGKIAVTNGVLDLHSKEFAPWSPQHFLRRKRAVAYDRAAKAPQFEAFLARLFADRDTKTALALANLLQEFAGAALCVRVLHREQRRALFLVGPSRTGKSELARLYARLLGPPIASPSVGQIGERFGLACFFDATGWVRDDAVNEGDKLDPQRFKVIVTGEALDIERKNRAAVRIELMIPVLLTANSLPASRDASDAVFNRSLVVDMTHIIDEQAAVAARRRLGVPASTLWLADFLFDREGAGILNWALAGLDRLLERGAFDIPESVRAAIQQFKDDSNMVAQFARAMIELAPDKKINRADLLCAFHGWLKEEAGDDARLHGARWLIPKLRMACPQAVPHKIMGRRYVCGIKLSDEALEHWKRQVDDAERSGRGSKGTSALAKDVNQDWTQRSFDEATENVPF
jgi:P4 family phage/plasmid primase-like protien